MCLAVLSLMMDSPSHQTPGNNNHRAKRIASCLHMRPEDSKSVTWD